MIERTTGAAARCSLVGAPVVRLQELPVWMLDAAACRWTRAASEPVAASSALAARRSHLPIIIVEIAMPRPRRQPRTQDHQADLVLSSPPPTPSSVPGWSTLPDQTRQAVTGLMIRLLIAHASGAGPGPGSDRDER